MDIQKEKKSKLLKTKARILRMPNTIEKVNIVQDYVNLLYYYKEMGCLSPENARDLEISDDFILKFFRRSIRDTEKYLNMVYESAPLLHSKYQEIIKTYQEEGFCSYQYSDNDKVNANKMYQLLADFFASLGEDVLKVYHNTIQSGNLLVSNYINAYGLALNTSSIDNSCIILQNIEPHFVYFVTLAHEMGHCYQFYLQRNQHNFAHFDPYVEITSSLFEKLFVKYLESINIIKNKEYYLSDHVFFLNDVAISKALCEMLIKDEFKCINPFELSYFLNVAVDDYYTSILNDCGYIMPSKEDLSIEAFHYSIGNAIAMYFMEKFNGNFNEEWKNFKDFICTVRYLPMDEVIKEYFDDDLIKKKIKEFMPSYRGR